MRILGCLKAEIASIKISNFVLRNIQTTDHERIRINSVVLLPLRVL
jgi:hypothetical protein